MDTDYESGDVITFWEGAPYPSTGLGILVSGEFEVELSNKHILRGHMTRMSNGYLFIETHQIKAKIGVVSSATRRNLIKEWERRKEENAKNRESES